MRVMVVRPGPRYSVADVHHGLVKGLQRCGVEVIDFRYDNLLELFGHVSIKRKGRWVGAFDEAGGATMAGEHLQAAVFRALPDAIILMSCFWIPPDVFAVLRKRQPRLIAWFTESPYEDDKQLGIAQWCDSVVVNDPKNLDLFRTVCRSAEYIPHAYDPDIHFPGEGRPEWACDVGFAGTGFPSRFEFVNAVDWSGIDLKLAGMWKLAEGTPIEARMIHPIDECLDNVDSATLYRSSRASFNLYRQETTPGSTADGWAMGPREVELAACGTFFLRDSRPEGDEAFPMLPTFTDAGDFGEKLRWWLAHDSQREAAALAARAAIQDRTFTASARRLLAMVEAAPIAA
jgi:spore maturation protein CgeB